MFDADHAKRLHDDVLQALKGVESKHGVQFQLGRSTYGVTLRMTLECSKIAPGGRPFNKERFDFKQFAEGYGLQPEDLGRTFMARGIPYEIVGLNIAAPKYPVLGMRKDTGGVYKFPADVVAVALKRRATPEQGER